MSDNHTKKPKLLHSSEHFRNVMATWKIDMCNFMESRQERRWDVLKADLA